ncbi:hypothetical protein NEOLEDRAFT_1092419 [Neolentinus lepideus HHB14362 ss-1]|uniref:Peptidase C14 caspase domain-containing protein n=1 Tax=Neolentinus lepideus HHB14362 ss-1 TaxID=1314782 RepID=A0A165SPX5_9AGAM|nr:hypothetical protein NEOLEDRAFT_1092419 [Neolentinus lepideus HHB14362 ss-1]
MNWPAFPKSELGAHASRPRRSVWHQPSPHRDAVQMPLPEQSIVNPAPVNAQAQLVYADGQTVQVPAGAHVIYVQGSSSRHEDRQRRHSSSHGHHRSSHTHSHSRPPVQSQEHPASHSHRHSHSQPQYIQAQNIQYPAPTQHAQYPSHSQQNQLPPLQHPDFQYSRCTGRKKALCIGINYTGQQAELHGCVNDAENVHRFLQKHYGFRSQDMVLLRDDARDPRDIPTKKNMIAAMRWLVKDAQPHDSLFIHYSGHGGQTKDLDGDEPDGLDEDIYPVDYKQAGVILDDDLYRLLVRPLPPACRLTAVFDSCHSGSILVNWTDSYTDLPILYHSDGRVKSTPQVTRKFRKKRTSPADVISFSGCTDSQTSADTSERGIAVGAMSYAFTLSLKRNPNQSYAQLLRSVRQILNKRYSQKPQLSSSHKIDTNLKFNI